MNLLIVGILRSAWIAVALLYAINGGALGIIVGAVMITLITPSPKG